MKTLLVTAALPYANGDIHIGHLVEYIQTDIFVRFNRLIGQDCIFVCADDTHGSPIMLHAKKSGISPEALIRDYQDRHQSDFSLFNIVFDIYGSTHTAENQHLSEQIYNKAYRKNAIEIKEIEQLFDEDEQMFLPDRFVKGTCPKCGTTDQYGDSCEQCGQTYSPDELIEPYSVISGKTPVRKKSDHYFFKLNQFKSIIENWLQHNPVRQEIKNKLQEWFSAGLRDWDISRDAPYFGFKIPNTTNKYFYVWVDAPIGYISTAELYAKAHMKIEGSIWNHESIEIHHFIGKDIMYFHTLFWPALLHAGDYKLPQKINIHGFLTVNGEKMSKSRGTFILASQFAKTFNPEFLRYYYAAKLTNSSEDIDLNLTDFMYKINSDVLGKFVNIASRLCALLEKNFNNTLTTVDAAGKTLLSQIEHKKATIQDYYTSLSYHKAIIEIMKCADDVNKFIDDKTPWKVNDIPREIIGSTLTTGLNACRLLCLYLKPIMPEITSKIESLFNRQRLEWNAGLEIIENQQINHYTHVAERIKKQDIDLFISEIKI
jgi:methionyl-tRNA synthetase